jgi:DNA-binding transcriptional regulator YhcF (GntR family)
MEFKNTSAIYLQITEYICDRILDKNWNAEHNIPSIREMAVTLEVNPNTIARAYSYLEEQGIIYTQRGIGYFVTQGAYDRIVTLRRENFLKNELPTIFKTMSLLNISFNELQNLRDAYENKQ